MTHVVFTALNENRIALTDCVAARPWRLRLQASSEHACTSEPGRPVTVDQLLRGMLTVSASDAAVALAEHSGNTTLRRLSRE